MKELTDAQLQSLYIGSVNRVKRNIDNCPTTEDLLYLAQKGKHTHDSESENRRLMLLDHVMGCAGCHKEWSMLRAVEEAGRMLELEEGDSPLCSSEIQGERGEERSNIRSLASDAKSAPKSSLPFKRWAYVGSLFAACAVVALGVKSVGNGWGDNEPVTRGRAYAIELISPSEGDLVSLPDSIALSTSSYVAFNWEPIARATTYHFEILDDDGRTLFSAATEQASYSLKVGDWLTQMQSIAGDSDVKVKWWVRADLEDGTSERSKMQSLEFRR